MEHFLFKSKAAFACHQPLLQDFLASEEILNAARDGWAVLDLIV
jgi:hypothetical protein